MSVLTRSGRHRHRPARRRRRRRSPVTSSGREEEVQHAGPRRLDHHDVHRLPRRRARGARDRPQPVADLPGDLQRNRADLAHPGRTAAAPTRLNLQQTLIVTTPLILCGLAVAFAFRCGMFNIGGQGQYFAGTYAAVIVGSMWSSIPGPAHIILCLVLATVCGAAWAGIAGFLKATTGAHEVISTIMLNWIAIWVGTYFFGLQGPFVSSPYNPESNEILPNVHLPVFWGSSVLQGLHIGFFIAIARARRLLGHPEPDDPRIRGSRRGIQPRGRPLQRDQRQAELLPRDGDLGSVRGPCGRDRHARLGVSHRNLRHPRLVGRLPRDRGCAPRPQHRRRRLLRGAALRGAHRRHVEPPARSERLRSIARGQPDPDHPGSRRPVRRRRPARALGLEGPQEGAAPQEGAPKRDCGAHHARRAPSACSSSAPRSGSASSGSSSGS